MAMLRTTLKLSLILTSIVILLSALFLGYMTIGRGTTPAISSPYSIASLETDKIGGVGQTILIRGTNQANPVLLWLHGGPGESEMRLRSYQAELEKHFVVVNWDQRGAGKSYSDQMKADSLNVKQFVSDAHELITMLKQRFHTDKIYLAGHSWGTVLGVKLVQQYPNDFYAYIGVGQVVDIVEGMEVSYDFVLDTARKENNQEAIKQLKQLKKPSHSLGVENLKIWGALINWVTTFQGSEYHNHRLKEVATMLNASEYSLSDWVSRKDGATLTKNSKVYEELLDVHFLEQVPELTVPAYFCQGTHDYHTPFALVERFYKQIKTPKKQLIPFTESAHSPEVEESERFASVLIQIKKDTYLP
ncbi:alpha/beta fold hydrolase [Aneurinibacillus tyrosinisolvens]|uniref:alpha/beta fold hydrolase n=1 Tax=Aneurinibacillus tyrosinisolvens TaxID=1443435 RepID=UPI00069B2C79|nr:alpha/beta hydrolase [Aneurinibacillus tyrosinisolvens]